LESDQLRVAGVPSVRRDFAYTPDSDVRALTVTDNPPDRALTSTQTFTYDGLHRLRAASGDAALPYTAALTYSAARNIRTATVTGAIGVPARVGVGYEYGDGTTADVQAVTALRAGSENLATFAYDPAGNMTERAVPGAGGLNARYLHDVDDQLRRVDVDGGGWEQYYYLGAVRFLAVRNDGSWRFYLGDEYEHDRGVGGGEESHAYIGGAARVTCPWTCPAVVGAANLTLLHRDRRGDLLAAVHKDGSVRAHFIYGAFGERLYAFEATAGDWRRRFNGKEQDLIDGLSYYGFRHYDPLIMRWTSADPAYRVGPDAALGAPERPNLYAFSLKNPLRYYDPNGLDPCRGAPLGTSNRGGPATDSPGGGGITGGDAALIAFTAGIGYGLKKLFSALFGGDDKPKGPPPVYNRG